MAEKKEPSDLSIDITAQPYCLSIIRHFIGCIATELHFTPENALQLELCVDEACANSISAIHAAEGNQPQSRLHVEVHINSTFIKITVHDSGHDFMQKFKKALPLSDETDRTQKRGYGLKIIKTFMDDVQYVHEPSTGNRLHLIKYFAGIRQETIDKQP
jgi:serine/threonine-protein kinase RsbW